MLRILFVLGIIHLCYFENSEAQEFKIDSLINEMSLSFRKGRIPMYYSLACKRKAVKTQKLLRDVIHLYSNDYQGTFKFNLAVVDSLDWTHLPYRYGFFIFANGWILIPGDLDYDKYARLYGFKPFSSILLRKFYPLSRYPEDLIVDTYYKRIPLHELGHYFIKNILNAAPPDHLTNELMASYFAADYLYRTDKKTFEAMRLNAETFSIEYNPKYHSIEDFNERYMDIGLENYIWYQATIQLMVIDIYSQYKTKFMSEFALAFPPSENSKVLTPDVILKKLDTITGGKTSKWNIKMRDGSKEIF